MNLKDGMYYKLILKGLFGKGSYLCVLKYDGIHDCFYLENGGVLQSNNKRILHIEAV